jgi:hypothetical protein
MDKMRKSFRLLYEKLKERHHLGNTGSDENLILKRMFKPLQVDGAVLMGKTKGKRSVERPRHRWEDGIKMDLKEIGWGCGVDSTGSG